MKRIIVAFLITLSATFSMGALATQPTAMAINPIPICDENAHGTDVCDEVGRGDGSNNPVIGVLKITINIVTFIIGVASVVIIIVSGIRLITSQGDAQGVASARSAIVYALIALVVVLLAKFIVGFVLNRIG